MTLLRELLERHAQTDVAFALEPGAAATPPAVIERLLRDREAAAWIVERGGAAVAFVAARVEAAPSAIAESRRCEITELYVRAPERRRGIGRALVDAALAWAREHGAARVEVRVAARNPEAQAFWRAQGFGDFVDVLDRRL